MIFGEHPGTNQELIASFNRASLHVTRSVFEDLSAKEYVDPFTAPVQGLIDAFSNGYKTANAEHDNETKRVLVEAFVDVIVNTDTVEFHGSDMILVGGTAGLHPSMAEFAASIGGAVQLLCNALNEIVEDKSLIPAGFPAKLLEAERQMRKYEKASPRWLHGLNGQPVNKKAWIAAVRGTADKIAESAKLFRPTPALKAPPFTV